MIRTMGEPIDEAVVRISPDFRRFRSEFRAGLARATSNVKVRVPVVVDTKGLAANLRAIGARSTIKIKTDIDTRGLTTKLRAAVERAQRGVKIKIPVELGEQREALRLARDQLSLERQQTREVARRRATRSDDLRAAFRSLRAPTLIDFGGEGLRPFNALITAAIAASPALLAVAGSAGYASTSIVALGAASIGTAAAISSLVVGFTGVMSSLKAYSAATKSQVRESASAAGQEMTRARAIGAATRAVISAQRAHTRAQADARRAQRELNQARREAVADLRELRELVSDLALDERGARIDVARAQEELTRTNADAKATALDRAEAELAVERAMDRLGDVQRERREQTAKLNATEKAGLNGSERVVQALDRRAQAQEAVRASAAAVTEAQQNVGDVSAQQAEKIGRASAAAMDLRTELDKLSPSGRRLFNQLVAMQPSWERFRRDVESAILPGFLTFMDDVRAKGRDGRSAMDLVSDSIVQMGAVTGRTVRQLGRLTRTPWFRGSMGKVNRENVKAFTNFGDAATLMIRPIMRLIAAASPQLTRFSAYVEGLALRFDRWIDRFTDADLAAHFRGAGTELSKWWQIAVNIGGAVIDVLRASLPTGQNLVSRLRDFTAEVRAWTSSTRGQERIRAFFDFFRRLDYGQIAKTVGAVVALFGAWKLITFAKINPIFTALSLLSANYPDTAVKVMNGVASGVGAIATVVARYPTQIATILALLGALRFARKINLGDMLGGKAGGGVLGKILGQATTNVMNVRASVVNVTGGNFGGGTATPGRGGPNGGPSGPVPVGMGRGGAGGTIASVIASMIIAWLVDELVNNTKVQHWFAITLPNALNLGVGQGGWKGLAENTGRWFSTTLPNYLAGNVGEGMAHGGWSNLATKLRRDFAITLPNLINPGKEDPRAGGWSTLGRDLMHGLWEGIKGGVDDMGKAFLGGWLWDKIKGFFKWALGINSPSVKMVPFGVELINGLMVGLTQRLGALRADFGRLGLRVVTAIVAPFAGLVGRLAAPLNAMKAWLDANLIKPLNTLLAKVKIPTLPYFTAAAAAGKARNTLTPVKRAAGGSVPGHSPHPRADNIPALLTANEFVMPVDAVRHYGPAAMEAIRRKEVPRFATGGMVWPHMWQWVHSRFPKATLNSAYRPGDPLYHGSGRAIDIGAPGVTNGGPYARGVFNAIKAAFKPSILELIWDFAGNKAVWNGRDHFFTGPGAGPGTHDDHIHWAMNGLPGAGNFGGLLSGAAGALSDFASTLTGPLRQAAATALSKARGAIPAGLPADITLGALKSMPSAVANYAVDRVSTFDTGGKLYPGRTLALNGTGGNETIRTARQEADLWSRPVRLDPRDLQTLATMIVAASSRPIDMDGKRVAEAMAANYYVPVGV